MLYSFTLWKKWFNPHYFIPISKVNSLWWLGQKKLEDCHSISKWNCLSQNYSMVQSAIFQDHISGKDQSLFPSDFSPIYLGGDGKEYRKSILKCVPVWFTGRGKRLGTTFLEASFKPKLRSSVVEMFVLASLFWHFINLLTHYKPLCVCLAV